MRVLFVSPEIYPLAKTGGLADVSAALPAALAKLGVDVRLLMPGYPHALHAAVDARLQAEIADPGVDGPVRLFAARMPVSNLPVWLVDCPALFMRPGGLYQDELGEEWPDNAYRFALFSRVGARLALGELAPDWRPDVVHANDWHSGLLPLLLKANQGGRPGTVFTVHNMAFQGHFPGTVFANLGLPAETLVPDGVEYYGGVSFLKAGLRYGDCLTTVSPSYAREILTPEGGCGLDGLLRARSCDLTGILNGVDYGLWDPGRDRHLPETYSSGKITGKRTCKAELQRELGLPPEPDLPLIIHLSRITDQKMADVVLEALPAILERGVQFAVLGQGDSALENRFREAARCRPDQLAVRIGYEEGLAHRFHAGADMLLHPSRFEPCGLTQLYAMRYGTVPLVRRVGGLADTVVDLDAESLRNGTATGFVFLEPTAEAMLASIDRALGFYRQPVAWRKLQRQAMRQDFGWEVSAQQYLSLYCRLAPEAAAVGTAEPVEPTLAGVAD